MKNAGQFIPYPATWLRANGWENDIASMNAGANHENSRRNPDRLRPAPGKRPAGYIEAPAGKYTAETCGF